MSVDQFISKASKRQAKKAEIKEIDIEKTYCQHAVSKDCKALKLIMLNKKGFPDRTTLCPGARILFIEFKRKRKKLSAAQVLVKKLLMSFGFEYYVCDTIGQA